MFYIIKHQFFDPFSKVILELHEMGLFYVKGFTSHGSGMKKAGEVAAIIRNKMHFTSCALFSSGFFMALRKHSSCNIHRRNTANYSKECVTAILY